MNVFLSMLTSHSDRNRALKRCKLETLQVNMGNLCNQGCLHCHVGASSQGKNIMSKGIIDDVLRFLSVNMGLILDITGGAPELNPHFEYFIEKAKPWVREVVVRSNLTVFFEEGRSHLPQFFQENKVHLICSLPCYTQQRVEAQRGQGVFRKSIEALKRLNALGYGMRSDLKLDIVHNPSDAFLPQEQNNLEEEYRLNLGGEYGINFNNLIAITNVPINRFKDYLQEQNKYETYLGVLRDSFNTNAVGNIMCRTLLNIGFDGKLYDCDFNQALGWALKDKEGNYLTIGRLKLKDLEVVEIMFGEHCFSCTAGYGSSCRGTLTDIHDAVKTYYGKTLKSQSDLKTSACCTGDAVPTAHRLILKEIHPEIKDKFYGCGSPLPSVLENCTVLDLGCGTGRDVYLVARLVGPSGKVIGVDMTDEQLDIAKKHLDYQMEKFGYAEPNVEFRKGCIENLKEMGIEENSMDVVISNCVINLSPDKERVFGEIFRVLKPGGELYFSDIFTGRRLPDYLSRDPVLYGECLGGALYIEDFRRILERVGCPDYRVVSERRITLNNPEITAKAGMIDFYSMTIRAFKLKDLEDICEDYGQVATYLGSITDLPYEFILDEYHIFQKAKPMLVCGNTASMLSNTRYAKHFNITGDRSRHFGPFNCKPAGEVKEKGDLGLGGCC